MIAHGRAVPISFSAMAAALSCVIALEVGNWRQPEPASPVRAAKAAEPNQALVPTGPDPYQDWFNQILARPLFNPDRHPIESGVRGLPRLTGIVVAGPQRVAIFAGPSNGRPVLAQAGARIGAYEVRSIADEGVTVVGPTGTSLVRPAFDPAQPAAPQAGRSTNLLPNRPQGR
jgi:hypothetical protein